MKSRLICICPDFPFGNKDIFLLPELKVLSENFDTVELLSYGESQEVLISLPENCIYSKFSIEFNTKDKLLSVTGLFDLKFWKELKVIRKFYKMKISYSILKTALITLSKAKRLNTILTKKNKLLQNEKIVIYSFWCDDIAVGSVLYKKKFPKTSVFTRVHGWDVYFEASTINYLPFRHFIAENVDAIFPISQFGFDYCINNWKIENPSVLKLAYLGVNIQAENIKLKKEKIIVSCSNVIALKRIQRIATSLLEIRDLKIRWIHFGDGVLLESLKQEFKSNINIEFDFRGFTENEEILKWYDTNSTTVFINVSVTEGIPVSIMEAMSFGIPVIATNVGGTSEIVNNENGILLKSDPTIFEISSAINLIMKMSEQEWQYKSFMAQATVAAKFDSQKNTNHLVKQMKS